MPHQLKPACLRPFCDALKVTVGRGAWKLSRIQEENIVQIFPKAAFWGCRITLGLPAGDFEFSSGRIESRLHSQVYKNNRNCRSFAHEIPAILCAWRYMSAREHPLSNQQFSQQRLSRQTPLNFAGQMRIPSFIKVSILLAMLMLSKKNHPSHVEKNLSLSRQLTSRVGSQLQSTAFAPSGPAICIQPCEMAAALFATQPESGKSSNDEKRSIGSSYFSGS